MLSNMDILHAASSAEGRKAAHSLLSAAEVYS